jgi:hypothetical protein
MVGLEYQDLERPFFEFLELESYLIHYYPYFQSLMGLEKNFHHVG